MTIMMELNCRVVLMMLMVGVMPLESGDVVIVMSDIGVFFAVFAMPLSEKFNETLAVFCRQVVRLVVKKRVGLNCVIVLVVIVLVMLFMIHRMLLQVVHEMALCHFVQMLVHSRGSSKVAFDS